MLNYFRTARRIDLLVVALVMLFFGGALVLDRVSSSVHLVLMVLGVHAWRKSGGWQALSRSEQFMLAGFAAWFAVGVTSYFLGVGGELGMKILGRDLRFLLAVPVYFVLKQAGLTVTHLRIAFALGGIAVGAVAAAQYFSADTVMVRASGRTISILFGHLCAALAMVNLALALLLRDPARWLSLVAAVAAMVAVWFSVTRGAMLAMLLVALFLLYRKVRQGFTRNEAVAFATSFVVIAGFVLSHGAGLERYTRGVGDGVQLAARVLQPAALPDRALPYCLSDNGFQEQLVAKSYFGGSGKAVVSHATMDEPWIAGDVHCDSGTRMVIENTSSRDHRWIYLPLRNVPLGAPVSASLLMRGRGIAGLGGWKAANRLKVDSEIVTRVDLEPMGTSDTRILIVLAPGQRIELIPLQIFRSEYAFPGAETSLGARLYMWMDAWRMFVDDPLFGKGVGGFAVTVRQHAREGSAPTAISEFDHPHNEWMTVLSERGLFGLLALLAIYGLSIRLFLARRDAIGWAGVAFVSSFLLSGLSETIFNHSLGITFYALVVLVLAAARPFAEPSATPSR